jgi:hypothetical protein
MTEGLGPPDLRDHNLNRHVHHPSCLSRRVGDLRFFPTVRDRW